MALLNFFSLSKLKQHWYKVEIIEITTVKRSLAILNALLCICSLSFIIEALDLLALPGSPSVTSAALP